MDAAIRGTTMPVLEIRLTPGESVVAETGQLGWFDDGIELTTTTVTAGADGMWDATKRTLGGSTLFMTRYSSSMKPGTVTFPARLPGQIFQIPLGPGRSYLIQRHGFLAGLEGSELSTAFDARHFGSGLVGGFGLLLQRLEGTGHAWIELAGELSQYELAEGESLRVHPAHIGLVEGSISYELTTVPGLKNEVFGGEGLFLVRLTGPGKVCLQSLSLPMLAHSLQPYLVRHGNGATRAQPAEAELEAGVITAAVKGLSSLL